MMESLPVSCLPRICPGIRFLEHAGSIERHVLFLVPPTRWKRRLANREGARGLDWAPTNEPLLQKR